MAGILRWWATGAVAVLALTMTACGGGGGNGGPGPGTGGGGATSGGSRTNANLSSLVVSAGAAVTLRPAFSAETTSYSAEVAEGSVTVTPTAEDDQATIAVDGAAVRSGAASQLIPIAGDSVDIPVVVTAGDQSTTRAYTVSVKRREVDAGEWVKIEPGTFTMGAPDGSAPTIPPELGRFPGELQHQVTLTRGFVILATEVTQQEFEGRMGYNPSTFPRDGSACPTCPVETLSWHEAAAYCNALSTARELQRCYDCTAGASSADVVCAPRADLTPYDCPGYRLPMEAEWEYAARAGDQRATYAGPLTGLNCDDATLGPIAWFCGNSDYRTHVVGSREANGWGLHDMLGNVEEWSHDWLDALGVGSAAVNPVNPTHIEAKRLVRGGTCTDLARFNRAAYRSDGYVAGDRSAVRGLRPVRSLN